MPRNEATARQVRPTYKGVALPSELRQEPGDAQGEPEEAPREEPRQQQEERVEAPRSAGTIRTPIPAGANPRAVQAAAERAQAESQVVGGRPNPANPQPRGTQRLGMRTPLIDVTHMTGDQAKEALQALLTQRRNQMNFAIAKAIRFNNGVEPNVQNGEVVSPRDTGSISVYGFARRPLTLYAGQWIQLAHYMPDILKFIENNLDDINGYVEQRLGNKSKNIDRGEVGKALQLFCLEQKGE